MPNIFRQTVPTAELFALCAALRRAGAVRIASDCQLVVDGIGKGQDYGDHPTRPARELWHKVWCEVARFGRQNVQARKVKAHIDQHAGESAQARSDRIGNGRADQAAGEAAVLARPPDLVSQGYVNAWDLVAEAATYMAKAAGSEHAKRDVELAGGGAG